MITGFNTDITYDGVTYHIQTEDKGLETPMILSLVYDGGTILASKRSPYEDLLEGVFDDKVLAERLQRQHRLICAAVKNGRIDDLKRMTANKPVPKPAESETIISVPQPEIVPQDLEPQNDRIGYETLKIPADISLKMPETPLEISLSDITEPPPLNLPAEAITEDFQPLTPAIFEDVEAVELPPAIKEYAALKAIKEQIVRAENRESGISEKLDPFEIETRRIPKPLEGLLFEPPKIIEEELILPAEAVAIVLDNISKPKVPRNKLHIKLFDETEFIGGDRRTLNISIHRGGNESGLVKAHVIIKILGSSFRPMIFHAKTDPDGVAIVHLQLPVFNSGRAVLLIRALHEGEEAEVRYPISQGGTRSS